MIKIKNPYLKQSYARLNTGDIIKHQIYGIGKVEKKHQSQLAFNSEMEYGEHSCLHLIILK